MTPVPPLEPERLAIVTGASSGVGLWTTRALVERGWIVVMACRDTAKARAAAEGLGLPLDRLVILPLDLSDLEHLDLIAAEVMPHV